MDYIIVFEIANSGAGITTFAFHGLIFIIIGIVINIKPQLMGKKWEGAKGRFFSVFFLGFAIFWTLIAGGSTFSSQKLHRENFETGNYRVVEGIVQNFDPMPYGGHQMESFTVDGVHFEYSDFVVTAGFNNTTSHGGPIKEGLPVRISYNGNTILKLEVGTIDSVPKKPELTDLVGDEETR